MSELNLNLSNVKFDETGKVEIQDVALGEILNELFLANENLRTESNNGCGNSANQGCGNNVSCAESSAVFNRDDVLIDDSVIKINKFEFNSAILKAKINGEENMTLIINPES